MAAAWCCVLHSNTPHTRTSHRSCRIRRSPSEGHNTTQSNTTQHNTTQHKATQHNICGISMLHVSRIARHGHSYIELVDAAWSSEAQVLSFDCRLVVEQCVHLCHQHNALSAIEGLDNDRNLVRGQRVLDRRACNLIGVIGRELQPLTDSMCAINQSINQSINQ
jgi:uncharacterized protein (UPF0264 family)